jgi:hypothetical protein
MIAKPILDKMKTITSFHPDFIDTIINRDSELSLWKNNDIISKELQRFLTNVITIHRHTPLDLKTQRPEVIRKVLGYLNELMLTEKVRITQGRI